MKKKLILPITVVLFALFFSAKAQDGPAIFASKCAACHSIGNGRLVGPDLKGVHSKYNATYLVKWIKSSQSVINSGDAKAKALFLEYNSIVMPDFLDLKDTDIKAIVGYIKSQSGPQQVVTAKKPQPQSQTKPKTAKP
ncbi:MAG: cytochrome c [Bacteroidota bacterium]